MGPDVDHQEKKIPAGAAKVDDFGDHRGPCPMLESEPNKERKKSRYIDEAYYWPLLLT